MALAQKNKKGNQNRIIKFSIVGLIGIFVDEGLLFVFTDIFHIFYLISSILSKEIALTHNFIINERWAFKDRRESGNAFTRLIKHNFVTAGGVVISLAVLFVLTNFLNMHYLISNIAGIFCSFMWNYFTNKRFTWEKKKSKNESGLKPIKSPLVSVVIPTYNEKENIVLVIPEVFRMFSKNGIKGEVVVVDDNSPDGTGKIALEMGKKYDVKVVEREGKLGLSSAFLEGYKHASGDIVGLMDADLSHPEESVPGMIKPIAKGEADFVIGSRKVSGGGVENWPIRRRIISEGASLLARGLTGVKDPMSGFFFIKKGVMDPDAMSPEGFKICLEIIVKGEYSKAMEVPYVFRDRMFGKSKLDIKEDIAYLKHLLKLYWYRANSPL